MADASKITVNGETYNVKDPTARNAASAAQTTANGKLSDAPADGKEYLRKNGAWAEPSGGGGSGVPDGGTTGQVLAKRSDTDGDAGWYSLRHLPSDKWYLPDGILESDVIAAYQFVNRLDEAEALLNVNDGVSYPLSKIIGTETWYLDKGFFIPGAVSVGLTNAALLSLYANVLSVAFGYSELNITGDRMAPGIMMDKSRALELRSYVGGYLKVPTISDLNGNSYRAGIHTPNGVLAGNWTDPPQMYKNGTSLSLTQSGSVNPQSTGKIIAQLNSGNFVSCYITALVFYNITLTSAQHLELSDNIRALGGID